MVDPYFVTSDNATKKCLTFFMIPVEKVVTYIQMMPVQFSGLVQDPGSTHSTEIKSVVNDFIAEFRLSTVRESTYSIFP